MYEGERTTKTTEWLGPNNPVSQVRDWLSTGSTVATLSPTHDATGEPTPQMTPFLHDPGPAQSSAPSPRGEDAGIYPPSEGSVTTGETSSPANVMTPQHYASNTNSVNLLSHSSRNTNSNVNNPQSLLSPFHNTAAEKDADYSTGHAETLSLRQPHKLDRLVDLEEEEGSRTGSVVASPSPPQRGGRLVDLEDEVDSEHAGDGSGRGASVHTT